MTNLCDRVITPSPVHTGAPSRQRPLWVWTKAVTGTPPGVAHGAAPLSGWRREQLHCDCIEGLSCRAAATVQAKEPCLRLYRLDWDHSRAEQLTHVKCTPGCSRCIHRAVQPHHSLMSGGFHPLRTVRRACCPRPQPAGLLPVSGLACSECFL